MTTSYPQALGQSPGTPAPSAFRTRSHAHSLHTGRRRAPDAPQHLVGAPAGRSLLAGLGGHRLRTALPMAPFLLLLAGASGSWFVLRTDLAAPTDTGLLTVLPPSYWLTVALLLTGVTAAVWWSGPHQWWAAAHTAALVVTLYGVGVLDSPYPRGTVPWRHVGVASELVSTRVVDPTIDAYFGWPGFFALLASFTELSGLEDGQALMKWAPVVNELLLMLPLLVVLRALTRDERLVWSAVTVFYLANWVDQDYLAPQAMSFFLYLCVLGLLLTFFRPPAAPSRAAPRSRADRVVLAVSRLVRGPGPGRDARGPGPPPATGRAAALLLSLVITASVVTMHQLTPFAVFLALLALSLARRTPVRGLPLMTGVLIIAWLSFSAVAYLQGNLSVLLAGVGDIVGAAQGGLVERIQGSPGHLQVIRGRLLFSLCIWGLAGLAVLLHYRRGRRDTTAVLLLASPGLLFGMQSYGGEMLLRIFMFSLPFAAFLAVQLLPDSRTPASRRAAGGLFLSGALVLAPAFVLVHYGNQLIDERSVAEVEAIEELYRVAPPTALLVAGNDNTAWRHTEYGDHRHVTLERLLEDDAPADAADVERALHAALSEQDAGGFVLLTRQQETYERLLGRRTPYSVADVQRRLVQGDLFEVVYRNDDAVVLRASSGGGS